jgi:hypothetical protein
MPSIDSLQDYLPTLVAFGCLAAIAVLITWINSLLAAAQEALRERLDLTSALSASQDRNSELSERLLQNTVLHMSERLKREEHHMLVHDSTVRNILASLERAACRKQSDSGE